VPDFLEIDWQLSSGVRAAFTLRTGGASQGAFATNNTAKHVGDDEAAVLANRAAIRAALALPTEPVWLNQVHGVAVCDLDNGVTAKMPVRDPRRTADAAVTSLPRQVCAIQVADCLPVLFATEDGARIGAAHAGWRGLVAGVLEAAVSSMRVSPDRLTAWLGPAIRQPHFEVGADVRDAFMASDPGAAAAFIPNERQRWQCDLAWLARRRLHAAGVRRVTDCGLCTYADRRRFFSYRRDGQCGRMTALIWRE
jgi:polyphenol oxidase